MIKVNVLFFATLKERAKTNRLTLEFDGEATVADLKARLAELSPELAPALPTALVSVNREFAFATDPLHDGDEVALFPPVSGGAEYKSQDSPRPALRASGAAGSPKSHGDAHVPTRAISNLQSPITIYQVTNDEIDLNHLVASITFPTTGAACIFTGMVRGVTTRRDPHTTEHLEYEAYVPMAEAKMKQVADEIREKWPVVEGIAIVQRIGRLEPGTPTVLIACSAAHRDTGVFEAARYGIDRLKEIVPIWKKEVGPSGEEWVEGGYAPTPNDRRENEQWAMNDE
jgi:molybdopterin synthase catalytic subunit